MAKKYLYFDLETGNSGDEWGKTPQEFIKLAQYAWNDGPITLTEDYNEILTAVRSADYVVGHNIISSDMGWLFGADSLEPLYMAMDRKVIDTFYLANLLFPAPPFFTRADGSKSSASGKPVGHTMTWLSLGNLTHQFNLPGKVGSLKEIAKRYNPPKTRVSDLDYSLIDVSDEEYREYAYNDIVAVRALFEHLLRAIKTQNYPGDVIWREMELQSAVCGQMKRNGILVDQEFGRKRVAEMEEIKSKHMKWLVEEFNFPEEGKAPWSSAAGKEAILQAFASYGITPESHDWPRTPKGNLKMGGEELKSLAAGTEAEEFADVIAELKGQRSIPQLVLDSTKADGRVHPDITALQRSSRWSFSSPGVTVFGERNERLRRDKALFTADEGNVLAGFDYSSADARAMAALSGDSVYAERFKTDENGNDLHDAHNLTGEAIFGKDVYYAGEESSKDARPFLRTVSKIAGHSMNYSVGAYKLAVTLNEVSKKENLGLTFWAYEGKKAKPIPKYEDSMHTRDFIENFHRTYSWLKAFKDDAVSEAEKYGYVTNTWGRRLYTEPGREHTSGPAMYGQGTTAGIMGDAVLRLIRRGEYYIRALRAIIHDELLLEFSEETIERDIQVVKECMEVEFEPHTGFGMKMNFPVGYGYGKHWAEAGH